MTLAILAPLAGYLVGSLASAIIVCRLMGLPDPREGGSGNPGATNVLRIGGKLPAALTLVGDVLQGVLPVAAGRLLGADDWVLVATALAAFLGHLYPVFFRFRGGKGLATALGVIATLAWPVVLGMVLVWGAVAGITRYSSAGSLSAAAVAPLLAWGFGLAAVYPAGIAVMTVFLFWRHRGNIKRLLAGTESRIGDKAERPA